MNMRKTILFILLTCLFSQTEKILVDLEQVQALRSELPQEITYIQDGYEHTIGRCGFIDFGNPDRVEKSDYIRKWKSDNPRHEDISIPIAFLSMQEWLSAYAYRIELNVALFAIPAIVLVLIALSTI